MKPRRRQVLLGAAPDLFPEGTHICLIYDNETQRRKAIGKFLALGLAAGEQVGYFADTTTPEEVHAWLAEMNRELPEKRREGAFEVLRAESVYCPTGKFVPSDMLAKLGGCYDRAVKEGYTGARVTGETSWLSKGIPGSERFVEYEALINQMVETHPVTAVCQYDAHVFDGATILNVLKVHPIMIVHGQLVRNPYYMRPEEFLGQAEPRV